MRVDAYNKVTQLYQTNSIQKTQKTSKTSSTDQVQISRTGQDYQIAKKAIASAADVRQDKINDIKKRMEAGTYNITTEDVANKLVDDCENRNIF